MKRRTITMRRIIRDAAYKHRKRRAPKRFPEFHLLNFYRPSIFADSRVMLPPNVYDSIVSDLSKGPP